MNRIELAWMKDKAVIRVVGKGSFLNSRNFKEAVIALLARSDKTIVIDFADCSGMDSTFIGVLTGITLRELKKSDKQMLLANLGKCNRELLETLGVIRFFNVMKNDCTFDAEFKSVADTPEDPDGAIEQIKHILEAHDNLIKANEENIDRFKLVKQTLEQELAQKIDEKKQRNGKKNQQ
ncbi:MAG: STAS domain-containing protein [Candidatus Auribacterota bacterium]|jgi:anti-anti-sigma regulatory factor|nr:STAS domain-containing protein [Candidatus Auribacterota bacterium]